MKKYIITLVLAVMGITQMFANLSVSNVRNHARFLTDRMAYELDLSPVQYDDIYEINYDYIYHVNRIMDDVVYGYRDAIDRYYDLLDDRNDDIHYVLTTSQYRKFMAARYFYLPIYSTGRIWEFRIYTVYSNRTFFYYDAPRHFKVYAGEHSRHICGKTYYMNRYEKQQHDRYNNHDYRIKSHQHRDAIRKNDFGINLRSRNDNEKNKVNNYNNSNSTNRTTHKYYRDNSGNKNAQEINNRNQQGGRGTTGATRQPVNNGGDKSTSNSSSNTQRGGQGSGRR